MSDSGKQENKGIYRFARIKYFQDGLVLWHLSVDHHCLCKGNFKIQESQDKVYKEFLEKGDILCMDCGRESARLLASREKYGSEK